MKKKIGYRKKKEASPGTVKKTSSSPRLFAEPLYAVPVCSICVHAPANRAPTQKRGLCVDELWKKGPELKGENTQHHKTAELRPFPAPIPPRGQGLTSTKQAHEKSVFRCVLFLWLGIRWRDGGWGVLLKAANLLVNTNTSEVTTGIVQLPSSLALRRLQLITKWSDYNNHHLPVCFSQNYC